MVSAGAKTVRQVTSERNGVSRNDRRARSSDEHGKDQANGSLSQNRDYLALTQLKQSNPFEASIHRLNPTSLIEGYTLRDPLHAALDNPIHYANVLGKSSTCGFEARGYTYLLVDWALGIEPPIAVKTVAAGDVVKQD